MPRKKLKRIRAAKDLPNIFVPPLKDNWLQNFFGNNNEITLELGCGKGEYAVFLAQMFPERNFLGVDVKLDRIFCGAQKARELKLTNVAFLKTHIRYLPEFFPAHSVAEIWLPFPDPFPKPCKHKKRLTSVYFLDIYRKFLQPQGIIHLKTDDEKLFQYTLEIIETKDLAIIKQIGIMEILGG